MGIYGSEYNIVCDNYKYLKGLGDKIDYDIIDIDAYGIPYRILERLFKVDYKGIIFITMIQSMIGCLPYGLLKYNGYSKAQIKKIPTLFYKNGFDKFKNYLAQKTDKIAYIRKGNKFYIYTQLC